MRKLTGTILAVSLFVALAGSARGDVIADWNERAVTAGDKARVGNSPTARAIAMVHLAMFEAVNSIEPRYTPYRVRLSVESGATPLPLAPPMLFWSA